MNMDFNIVKAKLTLEEVNDFVNSVVNAYFIYDDNNEIIGYTPYYGTLQEKIEFLKSYTDYNFEEDTAKMYEDICGLKISDYYNSDKLDLIQFVEIRDAIHEEVNVKRTIFIDSQNGLNKLLNSINALVNKIDFSKLNMDEMNQFVQKFNKSDLNAESIIEAYVKSDSYKDNKEKELNNIIDSKNDIINGIKTQMKKEILDELIKDSKAKNKASFNK